MAKEKRTIEEIDADLDMLKLEAAVGDREIDAAFLAEAFLLVLERFGFQIKLGLEGAIEATQNYVDALLGPALKEIAKMGAAGEEVAKKAVASLLGKIMFFIMLIMSWATFGMIPAPPNIEVVMFFYEWIRSIFDLRKEMEEEKETNPSPSSGNIV